MAERKEVITIENEKYIKTQIVTDYINDLESSISVLIECFESEEDNELHYLKQTCNDMCDVAGKLKKLFN